MYVQFWNFRQTGSGISGDCELTSTKFSSIRYTHSGRIENDVDHVHLLADCALLISFRKKNSRVKKPAEFVCFGIEREWILNIAIRSFVRFLFVFFSSSSSLSAFLLLLLLSFAARVQNWKRMVMNNKNSDMAKQPTTQLLHTLAKQNTFNALY